MQYIIGISELYGTGGVKSHLIESKKKIKFELKFINALTSDDEALKISSDKKETFYSTDVIYDVKSRIQKKYGIDPVFVDLVLNRNTHCIVARTSNSKSLQQMFPKIGQDTKDEFVLVMRKNAIFNTCPTYPYVNDETMNPEISITKSSPT